MKKITILIFTLIALTSSSSYCMERRPNCMKRRQRFSPNHLRKNYSSLKPTDIYTELRTILNSNYFDVIQFVAVEDKIYAQQSLKGYKTYLQFLVKHSEAIKKKDIFFDDDEISIDMIPLLIAHFPTKSFWMDAWLDKLGSNLLNNLPIVQTLLECFIADNDPLAISKLLNYLLEKGKRNKVKTTLFLTHLFNKPLMKEKENEPDIYLCDFALKTKKYKAAYRILRFLKTKLGQNLKKRFQPTIKSMKRSLHPAWYNKFMKLITS